MFSAGCLLYQLYTDDLVLPKYMHISWKKPPALPARISSAGRDLVKSLIQFEAADRPSAEEVLEKLGIKMSNQPPADKII